MKTYNIFSNPQGSLEAVKQGWSWPGFLFNIIWALVKKMWVLGGCLIVLFVALGAVKIATVSSSEEAAALAVGFVTAILKFIIAVVFGLNGNKWREKSLISRGYDCEGVVNADNPEAAITVWMKAGKGT